MQRFITAHWATLTATTIALICVLGFYQSSGAQQAGPTQPFANAVEQRAEIIIQLKQLNASLKEQNALLRSGELRVVVGQPKKP
jgi:hypothetical protein